MFFNSNKGAFFFFFLSAQLQQWKRFFVFIFFPYSERKIAFLLTLVASQSGVSEMLLYEMQASAAGTRNARSLGVRPEAEYRSQFS